MNISVKSIREMLSGGYALTNHHGMVFADAMHLEYGDWRFIKDDDIIAILSGELRGPNEFGDYELILGD